MPKEALPVHLDERPLQYVVQTIAACAGQHSRGIHARAFAERQPKAERSNDLLPTQRLQGEGWD